MTWSSDTPISVPVPSAVPVLVKFRGFGFSAHGITHTITEDDLDTLMTPVVMPVDFGGEDVR